MSESAKWRSGRKAERTSGTRPSGRGGKSAHAFCNKKREARERHGDVVVPARERAALEVSVRTLSEGLRITAFAGRGAA